MKAGYVFAAALLLAGCSTPTSETNVQGEANSENATSISALRARISTLAEQCNRIAVEREILSAKYNALIKVYHSGMKLDKSVIDRCSGSDIPSQPEETKAEVIEAKPEAERVVKKAEVQPAKLCWEGYCPCDPPQGGPDQLLCDSLRRGEVDPKMLSVGKSMRKARLEQARSRVHSPFAAAFGSFEAFAAECEAGMDAGNLDRADFSVVLCSVARWERAAG